MEKVIQEFKTITWSAGPGCHGGCGQKLQVRGGRLIRVEGDESNPWNQGRDCMRLGGSQIICVEPRHTWMPTHARYHLQLRPGTDGALALGMLHVIINENLCDHEFLAKWTFGFDRLKERVRQYPPDKVAEITWVPENLIVKAARLLAAAKPAGVHWGLAVDMAPEGSTVAQAISHLWCITGNVDVPGSNVIARASHGVTAYPWSTKESCLRASSIVRPAACVTALSASSCGRWANGRRWFCSNRCSAHPIRRKSGSWVRQGGQGRKMWSPEGRRGRENPEPAFCAGTEGSGRGAAQGMPAQSLR